MKDRKMNQPVPKPHYLGPHCIIHTKYIPVRKITNTCDEDKNKKIPEP